MRFGRRFAVSGFRGVRCSLAAEITELSAYLNAAREKVRVANAAHRKRELQCHYDADGCLLIHGRIPAEQGALIMKALDRAIARQYLQVP